MSFYKKLNLSNLGLTDNDIANDSNRVFYANKNIFVYINSSSKDKIGLYISKDGGDTFEKIVDSSHNDVFANSTVFEYINGYYYFGKSDIYKTKDFENFKKYECKNSEVSSWGGYNLYNNGYWMQIISEGYLCFADLDLTNEYGSHKIIVKSKNIDDSSENEYVSLYQPFPFIRNNQLYCLGSSHNIYKMGNISRITDKRVYFDDCKKIDKIEFDSSRSYLIEIVDGIVFICSYFGLYIWNGTNEEYLFPEGITPSAYIGQENGVYYFLNFYYDSKNKVVGKYDYKVDYIPYRFCYNYYHSSTTNSSGISGNIFPTIMYDNTSKSRYTIVIGKSKSFSYEEKKPDESKDLLDKNTKSNLKIWQGTKNEYDQGDTSVYAWKSSEALPEKSKSLHLSANSLLYLKDRFFVLPYDSDTFSYSMDGNTWNTGTFPSKRNWKAGVYAKDKFIILASGSSVSATSEDGINWTENALPYSGYWSSIAYGNGKFVAITSNENRKKYIYSEDGINWTENALPTSSYLESVIYANGKFILSISTYNSSVSGYYYSEDGINWKHGSFPSLQSWHSLTYGKDKFVVLAYKGLYAYSEDGINWTESTMPSSSSWYLLCYGNNMFLSIVANSTLYAYSEDGINWRQSSLTINSESSKYWFDLVGAADIFLAVASGNAAYNAVKISFEEVNSTVYTKSNNVTIGSSVSSTPTVDSAVKVIGVEDNKIKLSNNFTYTRDTSLDVDISTVSNVGQNHPDYLCFINDVGIKMNDKFIAKKHN